MTKNKSETSLREKLDNHFGEVCSYIEYIALNEVSSGKNEDESFISNLTEEEIKKNWNLVRHGIGFTASVFINSIIDQNGNINSEELDRILKEIKKIKVE